MAIYQKSAISFGLVYIPVNLYTATQDGDIPFNQLHKTDLARIRYKKVCSRCGKEVSSEDIVRGYQYAKDEYVVVTDEEIEKIKTQKDKTATVLCFVPPEEIDPIYYEKTYYLAPQKGGEKAFELLRSAMQHSGRAALGKAVLGNSEKLLALFPHEGGMTLQTLLFQDDIRPFEISYQKPVPSEAELDMAGRLISDMGATFSPETYHDAFREKLKVLIEDKIAGKKIVRAKEEKPSAVLDLYEALKASVRSVEKQTRPTPKSRASSPAKPRSARK